MIDHIKRLFGEGNSLVTTYNKNIYLVLPSKTKPRIAKALQEAFSPADYFCPQERYLEYLEQGCIVIYVGPTIGFMAMHPQNLENDLWNATLGEGTRTIPVKLISLSKMLERVTQHEKVPEGMSIN